MVKRKHFKIKDTKSINKYIKDYNIQPNFGYKLTKITDSSYSPTSLSLYYSKRKKVNLNIKEKTKIFKYYGSYNDKEKVSKILLNIKENGGYYRIKKDKGLFHIYIRNR